MSKLFVMGWFEGLPTQKMYLKIGQVDFFRENYLLLGTVDIFMIIFFVCRLSRWAAKQHAQIKYDK